MDLTDKIAVGFLLFLFSFFFFFLGYGIGIKDPNQKEKHELELQIKREELKNLQLSNQIKEMGLYGQEESGNED